MISNAQTIQLDFVLQNTYPVPIVYCKQGDSNSRQVKIIVYDNGVLRTENVSCSIYFNGIGGADPTYISASIVDGVCAFTVPQSALTVSGNVTAELRIVDENTVLSTVPFLIKCIASVYSADALLGTDTGDVLQNMVNDASESATAAQESASAASESATAAAQSAADALAAILNTLQYNGELTGTTALDSATQDGYYFVKASNGIDMLENSAAVVIVKSGDVGGGTVGIVQLVYGENVVATRTVWNVDIIDTQPWTIYATAASVANKVDKVAGKGLSTNDFTNAYKSKVESAVTVNSGLTSGDLVIAAGDKIVGTPGYVIGTDYYAIGVGVNMQIPNGNAIGEWYENDVKPIITSKVDKVSGKGLSTNDFTTDYKNQIDTNAAGIVAHTTSISALTASMANKVDKVTGKGLSTNDYTNDEKTKVSKLETNSSGDKALSDSGEYRYSAWASENASFTNGNVVVGAGSYSVQRSDVALEDLALKSYVDAAIQTSITAVMEASY